jgi:hypothetical protein
MVRQHRPAVTPARDLIAIITRVIRARDAGLDVNDSEAIEKLVRRIEPDLTPRINPDRRYGIREVECWGYTRGLMYGRYRHLIRKCGRSSFVLGGDLLAATEGAPRLVPAPLLPAAVVGAPRRRGRPRKASAGDANDAVPGVVNTC